jgi:hypothetical protein
MAVLWFLFLISAGFAQAAGTGAGWPDPEFEKVPFGQWLSGGPQTSLRWSERVLPVILSVHQRQLARIQVQLDGAEAAKRRGEGELIFYFQLTDTQGRIYQDHTSYDLEKVEVGLKSQDLVCTESVFVLPGDYSVAVAIYNTATKEHSIKKDKLHVAPLKTDPLPDAWRNLPAAEFVEPTDPPDRWFLPRIQGKLNLPLAPRHPLRIDVVANLTPSEVGGRSFGVQDRNFSFLFPSLKVISQVEAVDSTMNVSLLDISRRKVVFKQPAEGGLDWERIKSGLSNATSASIDVKSLADRRHNAAFFVKEIARRVAPTQDGEEPPRVVIVLSGPMVFGTDQDLQGIELRRPPDARVYYIRLQTVQSIRPLPDEQPYGRRRFGGGGSFPGRERRPDEVVEPPLNPRADQLEPMLKPLDPRLFEVNNADQFRKALAAILSDLATM